MPNYREFDDGRHFYDLRKLALEEGKKVEDLHLAPVRTRATRWDACCVRMRGMRTTASRRCGYWPARAMTLS